MAVPSEVLLHRDVQRAPAAHLGSLCPHPSEVSPPGRTQEVQTGCSRACREPWQAQALKYCVNVNTEHLQQAELFASMALALVSLHHDQKVVENIYTNRL